MGFDAVDQDLVVLVFTVLLCLLLDFGISGIWWFVWVVSGWLLRLFV